MVELKINLAEQLSEKRAEELIDREIEEAFRIESSRLFEDTSKNPFKKRKTSKNPFSGKNREIFIYWLKSKSRKSRAWKKIFDKTLQNQKIVNWSVSSGSNTKKVYKFVERTGKNSSLNLIIALKQMQFDTVNENVLKVVEREVEKRNFSITRKESSFLPIWIGNTTKPKSPVADNFIGSLFYTTEGEWLILLNRKNFRDLFEKEKELQNGRPAKDFFNEIFPNKDLGDYEHAGQPAFRQMNIKYFNKKLVSYFRARLNYAYKKSGTKPIQDIKLVETNKKPV